MRFRKMQAERAFNDRTIYSDSTMERVNLRSFETAGRAEPFLDRIPEPQHHRLLKVRCEECGRKFSTRQDAATCPNCGSGDIDLQ